MSRPSTMEAPTLNLLDLPLELVRLIMDQMVLARLTVDENGFFERVPRAFKLRLVNSRSSMKPANCLPSSMQLTAC
jgi:hypothetical protein